MCIFYSVSNLPAECVPCCDPTVLTTSKNQPILTGCRTQHSLGALKLSNYSGILSFMYGDFRLRSHEKPPSTRTILDNRSLLLQTAKKAPPSPDQIHHSQVRVSGHSQSKPPRGVHSEVIDGLLVHRHRLEKDEGVNIEDADGAVVGAGEEVAWEGGETRRGEEGERGDGGGVVEEDRTEFRAGGEIVELHGVVACGGSADGASDSDGLDGGEVRCVRKQRS
uniref:Uncharacterized protein n=1 Tax=Opuntia streptacantha TaxID=393608 RepID=A0A7C9A6N4_OPUST